MEVVQASADIPQVQGTAPKEPGGKNTAPAAETEQNLAALIVPPDAALKTISQLPSALVAAVKAEESARKTTLQKRQQHSSALKSLDRKITALADRFGWREKYFGGFLWGNRALVLEARTLEKKQASTSAKLEDLKVSETKHEKAVSHLLRGYLAEQLPRFKDLAQYQSAVAKLVKSTDRMLSVIETARGEIDDAHAMETVDLFTKSKAISLLSSLENGEAAEAASAVERELLRFKKDLRSFQSLIHSSRFEPPEASKIDDFPDLICDFAFGGFDFMSIFTLSALSDADGSLQDLERQVSKIGRTAEKKLGEIEGLFERSATHLRKLCS